MSTKEFAELLVYSVECGINFWDTAFQYETYPHIHEALKRIRRSDIVIATKLTTARKNDTLRDFHTSLRELGVDYVDVCLIHGVRTGDELRRRRRAFDTLLELKREGRVRAAGISSHGVSALKAAAEIPEIDVVWARINFAGLCVDSSKLGVYDRLASFYWIKKIEKAFIPKKIISAIRPHPELSGAAETDRTAVEETLRIIHSRSKGIVGMKVMAEGHLSAEAEKAVRYVKSLPYIDSFIIGMVNRREIDENCRVVNE
jgi:predicted aldo/keto reductase-like oxidoreductase